MLVKNLDEIIGTEADVNGEAWESRRLLLADDGLGYSFSDTVMKEGAHLTMHYKNHVETVYCISGEAQVTNEETGQTYRIKPGMMYVVNENERHTFTAITEFRDICIFTPPLTGNETHDSDGSYPAT
ncbi:ectoine synthase [Nocardia sp. NPDC058114]|uniref:ectoine synthase n=1 Tax=Nocardia sp. NPDC058114 TaxID=3346346 RepID=UPI0036DA27F1